jgi:nanoRNase/pAp phosphatase (c-di-AMP/oligoRNAs hydrolase)
VYVVQRRNSADIECFASLVAFRSVSQKIQVRVSVCVHVSVYLSHSPQSLCLERPQMENKMISRFTSILVYFHNVFALNLRNFHRH